MLKYFSKLRFGSNKFQPRLKCLENKIEAFMNPFLRAKLCKQEFDSVRSISFIPTEVESPDEPSNTYNKFLTDFFTSLVTSEEH